MDTEREREKWKQGVGRFGELEPQRTQGERERETDRQREGTQ